MRILRLSSKGGLYNPQQIRTVGCMLANTYGGKGSYKRIAYFEAYNPHPFISQFQKIALFVSKVTFP